MPMNPEIKRRWVKALRSGKYKQTEGNLQADGAFCCLGVLCELAREDGICTTTGTDIVSYDGEDDVLPVSVRKWAGLDSNNPEIKYQMDPEEAWYALGYYEDGNMPEGWRPEADDPEALFNWVSATGANDDYCFSFDKIADCIEISL